MVFNAVIFQYASIGDYVFLIMIVVISIIQAIAQNKKKKELMEQERQKPFQRKTDNSDEYDPEAAPMPEYDLPGDSIYDSFENILIPDTAEAEDESKHKWGDDYSEPSPKKQVATESKINTISQRISGYAEKLLPATDTNVQNGLPAKLHNEPPANTRKQRIREGFNLRKAVIYSEILNRKYT